MSAEMLGSRLGKARHGSRLGKARRGGAWQGEAWFKAGRGKARLGKARHGAPLN